MDLYKIIESTARSAEMLDKYYGSGKKSQVLYTKLFSTNIRTTNTIIVYIDKIREDINIPRNEWKKNPNHNQEVSKQCIVPLLASEMVYLTDNSTFNYTEKAKSIKSIDLNSLENIEELIVTSVICSNYSLIGNYSVFSETKEFIKVLLDHGYTIKRLENDIIKVLKSEKKFQFMENKLFLLMIYYRDELNRGRQSIVPYIMQLSDEEISDYYSKVDKEIEEKIFSSPLSYRLKPGGNLSKTTIQNMFILLLVVIRIQYSYGSYDNVIDNITSAFRGIKDFDEKKISVLFKEDSLKSITSKVIYDINKNINVENTIKNENIQVDKSTIQSAVSNDLLFNVLKPQVLSKSQYRCAFENIRNCSNSYFTSKSTLQNYLEVHHFLPRKYSMYIENGVEFFENYIPLCPNCHRMIHLATDNERRVFLAYLLKENEVLSQKIENANIDKCKSIQEKIEVLYDFE